MITRCPESKAKRILVDVLRPLDEAKNKPTTNTQPVSGTARFVSNGSMEVLPPKNLPTSQYHLQHYNSSGPITTRPALQSNSNSILVNSD